VYNELFVAWRFEIENDALGTLPSDFYVRIADYVRRIKEERRMLDKKALKTGILDREMKHAQRMIEDLVWTRYRKAVTLLTESKKLPSEVLTVEETALWERFLPFIEGYNNFIKTLLQGHVSKVTPFEHSKPHRRIALRFLKTIPSVVGVDMKIYGPFLAEDVGSLPVENAQLLINKGLAERVEVA
jgi:DNA replication factor GINS